MVLGLGGFCIDSSPYQVRLKSDSSPTMETWILIFVRVVYVISTLLLKKIAFGCRKF